MESVSVLKGKLAAGLGVDVLEIEAIRGGGNNRIYRIIADNGQSYAVKVYWRDARDGRDRLGTEFASLTFMYSSGLRCVPTPVFCDQSSGFAVYEYVEAEKIDCNHIATKDIEQVIRFLGALRRLTGRDEARSLPPASDACFSVGDIVNGVARRISRLKTVSGGNAGDRELSAFLEEDLVPYFDQTTAAAAESLERQGFSMDSALPMEKRTLSPSDYGFHNALRRSDDSLVFVDFEYFGWDDSSKMVVDFIQHPAMHLSSEQKRVFLEGMAGEFGEDLLERIEVVYPLHGIAWCTRLLNEYVPEHASRREFALHGAEGEHLSRGEQLQKARRKLQQVKQDYVEIIHEVQS